MVDAFKDAETTIDNGVLETISRAAGRAVYSGTWEPPMLHNARAVHEFAVRYGINTTENPLITELKETGQKVDGVKYIVRGAIDAITEAEADSPAEARRIFDEAMVRISAIGKRKDITNQQQTVAN